MSLLWGFRLDAVAHRILYLDAIRETETWHDLSHIIHVFQLRTTASRGWTLPM